MARAAMRLVVLLLTAAAAGAGRSLHRVSIPLQRHRRQHHWSLVQLLAAGAPRNSTHAIEYSGELELGGQRLSVLFDTGSDRLIVPGASCISTACLTHRLYNASLSTTAANFTDPPAREASFGAGNAVGFEAEDRVCLARACARVSFVEALEESEQPFADAAFDGVLGLSLALRQETSRNSHVLDALVDTGAIPRAQFSVSLAEPPEISFGTSDPAKAAGPTLWVPLSEAGFWQVSLTGLSVSGKRLSLCNSTLTEGENVSVFFGRMCCRSLSELEGEPRCQYSEGQHGWRSSTATAATVVKRFDDGRVAVQMQDGCVQKLPRRWLSLQSGCRGDGAIEAVFDTGSSVILGPKPIVQSVLAAVDCKRRPRLVFHLANRELTLEPEDYMDVLNLEKGVYCWPQLLEAPETGKGAVLILGMPFLRAYYTTFDAAGQRVGLAPAQRRTAETQEKTSHLRAVALHSRRPAGFDDTLAQALQAER